MYSREIDGRTITLTPSGWTYNRTFVLVDKETGSLWYPVNKGLMSIQGVYFKRLLPEVASTDTQWLRWIKAYPSTRLMR